MIDNCAKCHKGYELTPDNTEFRLYLGYPPANHIRTRCDHCGYQEIVYMSIDSILRLVNMNKFGIGFSDQPTPQRRQEADETWRKVGGFKAPGVADELPQAPREWLRQLHDDLRTFGSQS